MIFKGRIFGGVRKFHLDSYLNGTTVPFDTLINYMLKLWYMQHTLTFAFVTSCTPILLELSFCGTHKVNPLNSAGYLTLAQ